MAVAVLAAAAALPLVAGQHLLTAMIVALHAAFMALAWNVAAGYAGQFSLGHSLFFGIGAYASTVLYLRLVYFPFTPMNFGMGLTRVRFWDYFAGLTQSGATLVISSHTMDDAAHCRKLAFLRQGRVIALGSPAELRAATGAADASLEDAFLHFIKLGEVEPDDE